MAILNTIAISIFDRKAQTHNAKTYLFSPISLRNFPYIITLGPSALLFWLSTVERCVIRQEKIGHCRIDKLGDAHLSNFLNWGNLHSVCHLPSGRSRNVDRVLAEASRFPCSGLCLHLNSGGQEYQEAH